MAGDPGHLVMLVQLGAMLWDEVSYMRADLTSSMGRTPFFSPSMGSEKRL